MSEEFIEMMEKNAEEVRLLRGRIEILTRDIEEANKIIAGTLKMVYIHGVLDMDMNSELGDRMIAFTKRARKALAEIKELK